MTQQQLLICQMIGAALFDGTMPNFSEEDWNVIHREFIEQTIIALPATILENLPMPNDILNQWRLELMKESARSIKLIANQNELVQLLEKNGIPYVILKGVAAAKYYPFPWLRSMGDVDFIVPPSSFEQTCTLMLDHGFVRENEEDTRHDAFLLHGIHYELHRFFSTTEDGLGEKLDQLIFQGIPMAQRVTVLDFSACILPELENGIVLLAHISQHVKSGLGLRQMIDWFMYVKSELHDVQWPAFKKVSDQVGLTKLAKVATRLGQLYFGLDDSISWCKDTDEDICDELLEHLFKSGNFGHKDASNSATVFAMTRLRQNFFRTLQENGERNWKALRKYSVLKPFAWLYQLFRYISIGVTRKGILAKVGEDRERSKKLAGLMSKLGL